MVPVSSPRTRGVAACAGALGRGNGYRAPHRWVDRTVVRVCSGLVELVRPRLACIYRPRIERVVFFRNRVRDVVVVDEAYALTFGSS